MLRIELADWLESTRPNYDFDIPASEKAQKKMFAAMLLESATDGISDDKVVVLFHRCGAPEESGVPGIPTEVRADISVFGSQLTEEIGT